MAWMFEGRFAALIRMVAPSPGTSGPLSIRTLFGVTIGGPDWAGKGHHRSLRLCISFSAIIQHSNAQPAPTSQPAITSVG